MIGKANAYEYLYKLFKEDIVTSMMSLKMIMEMLEPFVMSTPCDTQIYIYIYIWDYDMWIFGQWRFRPS